MVVLTVIYSSVVVYANTNGNANSHDYPYPPYVVYAAYEYKKPPSKWYTPEELGIAKIIEVGEEGSAVEVVVDREKEPFPLQGSKAIFLYKGRFYIFSDRWVTFALPEYVKRWGFPMGGALGTGWIFTGALHNFWWYY